MGAELEKEENCCLALKDLKKLRIKSQARLLSKQKKREKEFLQEANNKTAKELNERENVLQEEEEKREEKILKKKTFNKKVSFLVMGYVATLLSVVTWFPVLMDAFLNKSTLCTLNVWLLILAIITQVFWIIYAVGVLSWPLLISSAVVLVMNSIVLYQKSVYLQNCPISSSSSSSSLGTEKETTISPKHQNPNQHSPFENWDLSWSDPVEPE